MAFRRVIQGFFGAGLAEAFSFRQALQHSGALRPLHRPHGADDCVLWSTSLGLWGVRHRPLRLGAFGQSKHERRGGTRHEQGIRSRLVTASEALGELVGAARKACIWTSSTSTSTACVTRSWSNSPEHMSLAGRYHIVLPEPLLRGEYRRLKRPPGWSRRASYSLAHPRRCAFLGTRSRASFRRLGILPIDRGD
jgi:hypothetical protein